MKAEISRDVISDLWPLYKAGEASAETTHLIEAHLKEDATFQTLLEASERVRSGMPDVALSPDAEMRLIALSREKIRATVWLVGLAIGAFVFVSMSFLFGALFFALSRS